MPRRNTPRDFWAHVRIQSGCWEWLGAQLEKGYGAFKLEGKQWRAHRLAWALTYGPIPRGKQINHHCDHPWCVNPKHLYVGDQKDNRQDAMRRGRTAKGARHGMHTHPEARSMGERNGMSKFSDGVFQELIKRYREGGISIAALSRETGVSRQSLWRRFSVLTA